MWSASEVARVADIAFAQKGKPYRFGAKPVLSEAEPGWFDCSGFVRWVIGQGRDTNGRQIILPLGSFQQIERCVAIARPPRVLDVGYFDSPNDDDDLVDHVILKINDAQVIEARGKPHNAVILRPIAKWENQKGFMGWWTVNGIYESW